MFIPIPILIIIDQINFMNIQTTKGSDSLRATITCKQHNRLAWNASSQIFYWINAINLRICCRERSSGENESNCTAMHNKIRGGTETLCVRHLTYHINEMWGCLGRRAMMMNKIETIHSGLLLFSHQNLIEKISLMNVWHDLWRSQLINFLPIKIFTVINFPQHILSHTARLTAKSQLCTHSMCAFTHYSYDVITHNPFLKTGNLSWLKHRKLSTLFSVSPYLEQVVVAARCVLR